MALTPEVRSSQAGSLLVYRSEAEALAMPQAQTLAVFAYPAENINVTFGGQNVVYNRVSQNMRATSGTVLAVVRGVVDNPKLRAWTYSLDGHDFYVLKLGTEGKTLIFDLTTGQWSSWTTKGRKNWRASVGMNWRSSGPIAHMYGSNVVVGDDSFGVLWVLDPLSGVDQDPLTEKEQDFERVATGQMVIRARNAEPIYSVYLNASRGEPALKANEVTLEYSDDQGRTYVPAIPSQSVIEGDYNQEIVWRSLGQVRAPGRLFRIRDNGSFARIEDLTVNE